jgi:hypothetical protein
MPVEKRFIDLVLAEDGGPQFAVERQEVAHAGRRTVPQKRPSPARSR